MNDFAYKSTYQTEGQYAHKNIDDNKYTSAEILTSISAYCCFYNVTCRIDIYNKKTRTLIERKNSISQIYDGQVFQMYAQYYAMIEMGYPVENLIIHSIKDNKKYKIELPERNLEMKGKFEKTLNDMKSFDLASFEQTNTSKCSRCIYEAACSFSTLEGECGVV